MITQQSSKQQERNAVAFKLKYSKNSQTLQNKYTSYEVDSVREDFGELFRVWNGRTLLGSFYENAGSKWKSNPYYQNRRCIELDKDLSKTFDSSQSAMAYIKATYEGMEDTDNHAYDSDDCSKSVEKKSLVIAA